MHEVAGAVVVGVHRLARGVRARADVDAFAVVVFVPRDVVTLAVHPAPGDHRVLDLVRVGVVAHAHALSASALEVHVVQDDAGDVAAGVAGADVDQPAVADGGLHAVLEGSDVADRRGPGCAAKLLLAVDGEALEVVVAVVDVDDARGSLEHRSVAASRVLARLGPDHADGRRCRPVRLGRELLVVGPGCEPDRRTWRRPVQRRLDGQKGSGGTGSGVGAGAAGADVEDRVGGLGGPARDGEADEQGGGEGERQHVGRSGHGGHLLMSLLMGSTGRRGTLTDLRLCTRVRGATEGARAGSRWGEIGAAAQQRDSTCAQTATRQRPDIRTSSDGLVYQGKVRRLFSGSAGNRVRRLGHRPTSCPVAATITTAAGGRSK